MEDLAKLQKLIDEYLAALDDSEKDERYDTERGFAEFGLKWFAEWLKDKEETP